LGERFADVDEFDLYQLEGVLKICQSSNSLSEAGRKLFGQSRQQKASSNDADRLKKYLSKFGVVWSFREM
jgi:transcriptional regulatory protein RtcR